MCWGEKQGSSCIRIVVEGGVYLYAQQPSFRMERAKLSCVLSGFFCTNTSSFVTKVHTVLCPSWPLIPTPLNVIVHFRLPLYLRWSFPCVLLTYCANLDCFLLMPVSIKCWSRINTGSKISQRSERLSDDSRQYGMWMGLNMERHDTYINTIFVSKRISDQILSS